MAAKKSTLETLHEMLTELFVEDIKICRMEGIPMSASDKAVIVKFLKDNDVTAAPDEVQTYRVWRIGYGDHLSILSEAKLPFDAYGRHEWRLQFCTVPDSRLRCFGDADIHN